jgi:hypothetical protein
VELTKDPTDEDVVGHLDRNVRRSLAGGNSYACVLNLSVCGEFEAAETMGVLAIIQRLRNAIHMLSNLVARTPFSLDLASTSII